MRKQINEEVIDREDLILLATDEIKEKNVCDEEEIIEIIERMSSKYWYPKEEDWDYVLNVLLAKYCK